MILNKIEFKINDYLVKRIYSLDKLFKLNYFVNFTICLLTHYRKMITLLSAAISLVNDQFNVLIYVYLIGIAIF